jgi:aryl-alcohol dehydrogenase-like predicted oxidoreductase
MKFIKLNNKITLSKFGIGTFKNYGEKLDFHTSEKIILKLYEKGINLVNSSINYQNGNAEKIVGKILKKNKLRNKFFIQSKIFFSIKKNIKSGLNKENIHFSLDNILKNYKTDFIDCILCHRYDPEVNIDELIELFENQIRNGKINYWGTTNWPYDKILEIKKKAKYKNRFIFNEQPANFFYKKNLDLLKKTQKNFFNIAYGVLSKGLITNNFIIKKKSKKLKDNINFTNNNINLLENLFVYCKKSNISLEEFCYSFLIHKKFIDIILLGISSHNYLNNLNFKKIFSRQILYKCLTEMNENKKIQNFIQNWK